MTSTCLKQDSPPSPAAARDDDDEARIRRTGADDGRCDTSAHSKCFSVFSCNGLRRARALSCHTHLTPRHDVTTCVTTSSSSSSSSVKTLETSQHVRPAARVRARRPTERTRSSVFTSRMIKLGIKQRPDIYNRQLFWSLLSSSHF